MFAKNSVEMLQILKEKGISISRYTIEQEMEQNGKSEEQVRKQMAEMLDVMKKETQNALDEPIYSVSGFTGGDAYLFDKYRDDGKAIVGDLVANSIAMALSCAETNSAMGVIVACPTAGSCGIVPAVVLSTAKRYNLDDEKIIDGLFTASGIGVLIGQNATVAGAEGGCQAECGSAGAMAAGAVVEMMGGSPTQAFHAAAMVFKSTMGLICDPVAGLVEIPCIKRNATGAANALVCADMALAGIHSYIPFDEVLDTMAAVGKAMPEAFRETAQGGVATTPTGLKLKEELLGKK